jgi:uncharacterized membrane protein
MRIKALWFLLVASLALNVFFVAGVLYPGLTGQANTQRERPDPVAQATRDFALDDRQVAALEALRAGVIERREARRDEGEGFRSLIVEALRQPDFDREALDAALQQRREDFGDLVLDLTEDLHGFLATLTPDQKAAFLERARERDFLRRLLFPPRRDGRSRQ